MGFDTEMRKFKKMQSFKSQLQKAIEESFYQDKFLSDEDYNKLIEVLGSVENSIAKQKLKICDLNEEESDYYK